MLQRRRWGGRLSWEGNHELMGSFPLLLGNAWRASPDRLENPFQGTKGNACTGRRFAQEYCPLCKPMGRMAEEVSTSEFINEKKRVCKQVKQQATKAYLKKLWN